MPAAYPNGGPLFWSHETSGVLAPIVMAYLKRKPLTAEQLDILVEYCVHWINAPCWGGAESDVHGDLAEEFADLRDRIKRITTARDLQRWCLDALDVGIDPF